MKPNLHGNRLAKELWTSLFFGTLVIILIWVFSSNFDSISRRRATNSQMQSLADRVKTDPDDKVALQKLIDHLDDPYHWARTRAAYSLGSLQSKAKDAVPALGRCLKSNNGFLRRAASEALRDIGMDSRAAIPDLIDALKLGNEDTAWFSAEILGRFPEDSELIVPALIESLRTHNLDNLYGDPGPQLAFEAAHSLGGFGPKAVDAIPALKAGLTHTNIQLKFHFSAAIRAIDPHDDESLQTLLDFLDHPWMGRWAFEALASPSRNASAAIPAIEEYLKGDLTPSDRQRAEYTLFKIRGNSPQSLQLPLSAPAEK